MAGHNCHTPQFVLELPVVIFSSSSRVADKLRARDLGAIDYWEKPNSSLLFSNVVQGLKEKWLSRPV
jgi:CheY-like chemotaxis protein